MFVRIKDTTEHKHVCTWLEGQKVEDHYFKCGTTLPGNPSKCKRHKRVEKDGMHETITYHKEISRPTMIELFFSCFCAIDVQDHYHQGSLAFEREWYTHCWWHRLFATVFGMCIVDAYLAYKFEAERNGDPTDDFKGFIGKLAYQLIHNHYLDQPMELRSISNEHDDVSEEVYFS